MTTEEALEIFDRAAHMSIRPRGCTVVLSFSPYTRAEGRRKRGESFSAMICRIAAKALDNQAKGITAPCLLDLCEACGMAYSSDTPDGKLCRKCVAGLKEIRRKPRTDRTITSMSIKGLIG